MKKICFILFFVLLTISSAYAVGGLVYVGRDDGGSDWYLDRQSVYVYGDIIDFCLILGKPYGQNALEWLKNEVEDIRKAQYIFYHTNKIEERYNLDLKRSAFCLRNVFFYDEQGEFLHTTSYGAIVSGWYPVSSNRLVNNALGWINRNILSVPKENTARKMTIEEALAEIHREKQRTPIQAKSPQPQYGVSEIVMYSLCGGVLVSVLLVVLYLKFSGDTDAAPDTDTAPESQAPEPESDYIDAEIVDDADDFDYPYEDFSKVV